MAGKKVRAANNVSTNPKFTASPRKMLPGTCVGVVLMVALTLSIVKGGEPAAPVTPPRSVADGVYSAAQVARGRRGYNALCARCHGEALGGGEDSPALVDKVFFKGWAGKSVGELVEYTRTEMPSDGPGKVTRKQSTDITVYVLSANGFPAGPTDLDPTLELLNQILITPKK